MGDGGQIPEEWGDDPLSEHIAVACNKARVSFVQRPSQYKLTHDVDAVYRDVLGRAEELSNTEAWMAPLFIHGSHASFLASVQLALAGQLPQSFMVQRGTLEYALYGFYLAADEKRQETWLNRHKSAEHLKAVKQEFRPSTFLSLVTKCDSKIGVRCKELYELAIDHGAHPNSRGVIQVLTEERTESTRRIGADYFSHEHPFFENCLRCTVGIGITSMRVFGLLWPEQFEGWGTFEELSRLDTVCYGAEEA